MSNSRTIRLQIAATETHCGENGQQCKCLDSTWPRCNAFPESKDDPRYDSEKGYHKRLPECIAAEAAEKEAGK